MPIISHHPPKERTIYLGEPWGTLASLVLIWLGLLAVATFALHLTGAFQREFDGNSDEASHMLTSLLVRDYLVSGTPLPPISYAEQHYLAYPKSAFGIWPPLFHLLAGGWFVLFEPTRGSAILLMAALLALSAVLVFAGLRREIGNPAAGVLSLAMVCCPLMISEFGVVIADALLVPLVLAATLSFARFLESHTLGHSLWFGVFSALAFLTKYNALELIFVPLLGIALTRQWRLWRSPKLWAAPVLILMVAGPWYAQQVAMVYYAADPGPGGMPSMFTSAVENLQGLVRFTGLLGTFLAVVGLCSRLGYRARCTANAASLAGLLFGVWAMHSFLYPLADPRYLLPALPALLYFSCAGLFRIVRACQSLVPPVYAARGLAALTFALMIIGRPPERSNRGWRQLTAHLREIAPTKVFMVSGVGTAEGAMIAEMALGDSHRQARPEWMVLRGSKMLAKSTWSNGGYQARFAGSPDILRSLKTWGVSVVAMELRHELQPHERLLLSALQTPGTSWHEELGLDGVRVFVDRGPTGRASAPIEVDLTYTIGRKLLSFPRAY